jgi:hypothetical protein
MTLNNTTHKNDELPETMAALRKAEAEGHGHRDLIPISDPYWSKNRDGSLSYSDHTDKYAMGEEGASRLSWWHGEKDMKSGQAKVGDKVLSLGTDHIDAKDPAAQAQVQEHWREALAAGGMDETYIDKTIDALLKNKDGSFKKLGSGDGAINELYQYAMVMYRAEKGEFNVKNIVFSGHHWRGDGGNGDSALREEGGHGIWGETEGITDMNEYHYDDQDDFFSLVDVASLKGAFPEAYKDVQSVQLAACNTDSLEIPDGKGGTFTTNEFLQDTFKNIKMSSYWKETLAPLARSGYATNGEFILDSMRLENGDEKAAKDSRHNEKGLKRSLLTEEGKLDEITMKTNSRSYKSSLKGSSKRDFDERTDLSKHLHKVDSLPKTKLKPLEKRIEDELKVEEAKPAPEPKTETNHNESGGSFWDIFSGW